MINFVLGYIAGIVTAVLVIVALIYFRRVIEHTMKIVEKQIEAVGPRPRGFIIEPGSEADEFRENIIKKNKKLGIDTKVSDLE